MSSVINIKTIVIFISSKCNSTNKQTTTTILPAYVIILSEKTNTKYIVRFLFHSWQVFLFDFSRPISTVTFCCRENISISGKWYLNVLQHTGIISHKIAATTKQHSQNKLTTAPQISKQCTCHSCQWWPQLYFWLLSCATNGFGNANFSEFGDGGVKNLQRNPKRHILVWFHTFWNMNCANPLCFFSLGESTNKGRLQKTTQNSTYWREILNFTKFN